MIASLDNRPIINSTKIFIHSYVDTHNHKAVGVNLTVDKNLDVRVPMANEKIN